MDIGIGLPNTLEHPGPLMIDWARRAEERGFSALATIDRIVYPTYDSLTSLAVAAGATSRIRLLTGVLLAPLYPAAWLAKAAAGLDAMSGGRLTLGLGVGARGDDFEAVGRSLSDRGRAMDEVLEDLRRAWAGEPRDADAFPLAPRPATPAVPLLIGGESAAALRRTVSHGQGWIAGGGGPDAAAPMIEKVRGAWHAAGREGEPRFAALAYYGLGDEAASRAALLKYYGFMGEDWARAVADSALRTPERLRAAVAGYAEVGVDELLLVPTIAGLDQVDRLADVVL